MPALRPFKVKVKSMPRGGMALHVNGLYERSAPLLIANALLFGAVAAYMFWRPMTVLTFLTYVVGAGLVLFGLWRAIAGFVSTRGNGAILDVLFGLLNVILGVLFCIYPTDSIIGLSYIFVILFFFNALRALVFAVNMARVRFGFWRFNLVLALIMTLVAGALFVWPLATVVAIVYYMAAALAIYAVVDVYMFVELMRLRRAATS